MWKEEDAWWFLLRRLLAGMAPSPGVPKAISVDLLEDLRKEEQRPPKRSAPELRRALESIFPAHVYPGENEAFFHRWLLSRAKDGNGDFYPRVLLGFSRECQEQQRRVGVAQPAPSVFDRKVVRDGFIGASKEHAETIFSELPHLRSYLDVLGKRPFARTQIRYRREDLIDEFRKVHTQENRVVGPETALKTLESLGILAHAPGSWSGERYDYLIPSLYKFALVNPKGRV